MSDVIIIVTDSGPNRVKLAPNATLIPKASREERRLASGILFRLRPNQSGFLTAIIGSGNEANDTEAIVVWLRNNRYRLEEPSNLQHCYHAIKQDIEDSMNWEDY